MFEFCRIEFMFTVNNRRVDDDECEATARGDGGLASDDGGLAGDGGGIAAAIDRSTSRLPFPGD
jgi:hypothetical protein